MRADIRQRMRLDSDHTHVGAASATHTYAGLTVPFARGKELNEGHGQSETLEVDERLSYGVRRIIQFSNGSTVVD